MQQWNLKKSNNFCRCRQTFERMLLRMSLLKLRRKINVTERNLLQHNPSVIERLLKPMQSDNIMESITRMIFCVTVGLHITCISGSLRQWHHRHSSPTTTNSITSSTATNPTYVHPTCRRSSSSYHTTYPTTYLTFHSSMDTSCCIR